MNKDCIVTMKIVREEIAYCCEVTEESELQSVKCKQMANCNCHLNALIAKENTQ